MINRLFKILVFILLTTNIVAQSYTKQELSKIKDNLNEKKILSPPYWSEMLDEGVLTSSVIIIETVILLLVLYYWRKTKGDSENTSKLNLKKNIEAIRNERLNPNILVTGNKYRKLLNNTIKLDSLNSRFLTTKAKKTSVAKGELLLIARIKQLQNQNI